MIVLDASAAIEWLEERPRAAQVEAVVLAADGIHVPHLWFIEVAQVLRRHVLHDDLTEARAAAALDLAAMIPTHRHAHEPLAARVWALRDNLSAYDAVYVALAEVLGATLITTDERLANSPGHVATIALID